MPREPDWEALADLQFILYNRIADSLNAALSAIALSDMPEAQDKPPGFWKKRAATKIANVINLYTAWSYLTRYKLGETIPERAVRPFRVNALLAWLGDQLQLVPPPTVASNPLLHANQETLQEALLLLYSAAFTQGTGVRLEFEPSAQGMWFRVQFARPTPLPPTLDGLLAAFKDHWRAQDTVFELTTARDFVRLNGGELALHPSATGGEFAFFVHAAGVPKDQVPATPAVHTSVIAVPPPPSALPKTQIKEADTTPVLQVSAPGVQADSPAEPPTLAVLRPPPQGASVPVPISPASAAEGRQPPVEPEDSTPKPAVISSPAETSMSAPTPLVPLKPPASRQPSVIVPVKIPAPQPPSILRTPPASTSHVALPRETQTMPPVKPEAAPTPAENQDATSREGEPPDNAPAPDAGSTREGNE